MFCEGICEKYSPLIAECAGRKYCSDKKDCATTGETTLLLLGTLCAYDIGRYCIGRSDYSAAHSCLVRYVVILDALALAGITIKPCIVT
jgi:hypothetical protein